MVHVMDREITENYLTLIRFRLWINMQIRRATNPSSNGQGSLLC